jgi:AmmeMemoRadiSam system protein B
MERDPAVAGRFYPADGTRLAREVDGYMGATAGAPAPVPAIGLVAPHAGYVYSGAVAGAVYGRVVVPPRVLVLGPNHTGRGEWVALWPGGAWRTPLGKVPVDPGLTAALASSARVAGDRAAHALEHSLEVQVPFLLRRQPALAIAALCLGPLPWPDCRALGEDVAAAARETGALLVASSDMSHYLPAAAARARDARALERVEALDPQGLLETCRREGITMCGVVPATVMLVAALELGATRAEVVRYGHSGEVSGDDDAVVGYAGVIVT